MLKICSKCNSEKSLDDFYKSNSNKSGFYNHCKRCDNINRNKNYHKNKRKVYETRLKELYGITIDDYNAMFQRQRGQCAICGIHQSQHKRPLAVDHDHKTGKVRGLLCDPCNWILGRAHDSIEVLTGCIFYLKGSECHR